MTSTAPLALIAAAPGEYLAGDDVIETKHPEVLRLAASLRAQHATDTVYAKAAFEWVRDNVAHSWDAQDRRVTVTATDALRERVGLCYVKSHLLAALLRTEGIPTGLCYQRLGDPATGFALHGLVAVHLDGAWHRQDPRGNKDGVDAQFSLSGERLAWVVEEPGEVDYPTVYVAPLPNVLSALRQADDLLALYQGGLPDDLAAPA